MQSRHNVCVDIIDLTVDDVNSSKETSPPPQSDLHQKDPRHRIEAPRLLEEVITAKKSTFTSQKDVVALSETADVEVGIPVVKNGESAPLAEPPVPYTPKSRKRQHEETTSNDEDLTLGLSAEIASDNLGGRSSTNFKRRWSGLRASTPTNSQAAGRGLRTPPSSKGTGQIAVFPRSVSLQSPSGSLTKYPIVLVSSTAYAASPASSSSSSTTTVKSKTSSSYVPSPSEETEEDFLDPTPSPPPICDGETTSPDLMEEEGDARGDEEYVMSMQGESTPKSIDSPAEEAELPLLGYRGYSGASQGLNGEQGFRAGAFVNVDDVPICPKIESRYYIDEATRHVAMDNTRPTTFISLTRNPIRAITRAFGGGNKKHHDPRLAVINLHLLRNIGVLQIAANLNLNPPKVRYDARGELLIWGSIPKEAIVSIIDVHDLLNRPPSCLEDDDVFAFRVIMKTWCTYHLRKELYKKKLNLTHSTGLAVGQLLTLLRVPGVYREAVVGIIIKDWAFCIKKHQQWQNEEDFCEGVEEGLRYGLPELRLNTPKEAQPVIKGAKHSCSAKGHLIVKAPSAKPGSVTHDTTPVLSNMNIEMQAISTANSTPINAGTSPDFMAMDHEEQVEPNKAQQDKIFAALPASYEAEMKELEDIGQPQNTRLQAYEALSGLPATYEIKMLMDIWVSLKCDGKG